MLPRLKNSEFNHLVESEVFINKVRENFLKLYGEKSLPAWKEVAPDLCKALNHCNEWVGWGPVIRILFKYGLSGKSLKLVQLKNILSEEDLVGLDISNIRPPLSKEVSPEAVQECLLGIDNIIDNSIPDGIDPVAFAQQIAYAIQCKYGPPQATEPPKEVKEVARTKRTAPAKQAPPPKSAHPKVTELNQALKKVHAEISSVVKKTGEKLALDHHLMVRKMGLLDQKYSFRG